MSNLPHYWLQTNIDQILRPASTPEGPVTRHLYWQIGYPKNSLSTTVRFLASGASQPLYSRLLSSAAMSARQIDHTTYMTHFDDCMRSWDHPIGRTTVQTVHRQMDLRNESNPVFR